MKRVPLLSQIVAINALLVLVTVLVGLVSTSLSLNVAHDRKQFLILFLGVLGTLLGNGLLLRRRLEPLERLVDEMERVDLATAEPPELIDADSEEVARLQGAFRRMLDRLRAERRAGARAVLRAQEAERQRVAQDLHDEVNQALTAIVLRLEATAQSAPPELAAELRETRRLAGQAMEELLHLARELRPTALDDHGLLAALRTQVEDFRDRTGIEAAFHRRGDMPVLSNDQQLVVYRVTQESLSNIAQHAGASKVDVELSFVGRPILKIADDGRGIAADRRNGRTGSLGLSGMQERALLVGGRLDIHSTEGRGTTVTLTM
jgi:two-component system sensor histidine kinase UhpB